MRARNASTDTAVAGIRTRACPWRSTKRDTPGETSELVTAKVAATAPASP